MGWNPLARLQPPPIVEHAEPEPVLAVGSVTGPWRILSAPRDGAVAVECTTCGACSRPPVATFAASVCLAIGPDGTPCLAGADPAMSEHERERLARLASVPRLDCELPWADDHDARALVSLHPDGLSLADVSRAFGLSRERVRQIESAALRRVAEVLGAAGYGTESDRLRALALTGEPE